MLSLKKLQYISKVSSWDEPRPELEPGIELDPVELLRLSLSVVLNLPSWILYSARPSWSRSTSLNASTCPSSSWTKLCLQSAASWSLSGVAISRTNFGRSFELLRVSPYFCKYSMGFALMTPKYLTSCLTSTSGACHSIMTFFGFKTLAALSLLRLKTTLRFDSLYGSHRSTMTPCGLLGSGAKRSMTTFLGGGGNFLPEILMYFLLTVRGGAGGSSRIIKGSGVRTRD